jgi:O-antigen/teichoic acid export membrane protein
MGILTRILKVMAALLTSNAVNLVAKLLLPPIFLFRYGTTLYGEWIALSGAVAYLSTLNVGIQTYVSQDLTVRYQQNDLVGYHLRQSTALRLLLGILGSAALLCLVVFALPVQSWLRLTISQKVAAETLYLLALQVLLSVLFGYFSGMYMVLSRAHAGVHWGNAARLTLALVVSGGAWARLPFPVLAGLQLAVYAVGTALVLLHLRRIAPEIFPKVSLWDRHAVGQILRPSGYFGLIGTSTFLSFEVPVLVMQREVGPIVVVAFTVMRTIFSMCRQILNAPSQALGPEITRLFGRRQWPELTAIYRHSERIVFSLIPTVNLGVLVVSPVLLAIWLHRPDLFAVAPYVVMAAVSMMLSTKEHKFQFQSSTNSHEGMAKAMFSSYIVLAVLSVPVIAWHGMLGFLFLWFAVELFQTIFVVRLNHRLFAETGGHTNRYLYRLAALCIVGLYAAGMVLAHTHTDPFAIQIGAGFAVSACLALAAFVLFNMRGTIKAVSGRMSRKSPVEKIKA